jgi:hypothetical protein
MPYLPLHQRIIDSDDVVAGTAGRLRAFAPPSGRRWVEMAFFVESAAKGNAPIRDTIYVSSLYPTPITVSSFLRRARKVFEHPAARDPFESF